MPSAERPLDVRQVCGAERIAAALDAGAPVTLLLLREAATDARVCATVERARALGIPVRTASAGVLQRLSQFGERAELLALVGRPPSGDAEALLRAPGAVWLLSGVSYPGNAGFVIRTAEVSGAAGIILDARFDRSGRRSALRLSMRSDWFMPVCWERSETIVERAVTVGRRVIGIEDCGECAPWDVDLRGPLLLVVGAERGGVPPAILARCDPVVRVPMAGFLPTYNLQAAVAAVAVERLRQLGAAAT